MNALVRGILILVLGGFLATSCIDAPSFNDTPELSNPQVLLARTPVSGAIGATDTILLKFDFADGNGDIGYVLSDSNNIPPPHVYLTFEEFDTTFTQYTIPILPANGGVPDITGTVTITILAGTGTFFGACQSNPQVNTVTYSVFIKDRSGAASNEITFPTIPIDCP